MKLAVSDFHLGYNDDALEQAAQAFEKQRKLRMQSFARGLV